MSFGRFHTFFFIIFGVIIGIFLSSIVHSPIPDTNSGDVFSSDKIEKTKQILQKKYYHFDQKTREEIENGMISSLVNSLGDRHSSYFTPKEAREFDEMLGGGFEGIGAVIDDHPKGIFIRKIFDNAPAKKAGLQDGDIITKVGNESMVGVKVEDAVKKIRGPKGSTVTLYYIHKDEYEKKTEVTRDTITVPSVQSSILTGTTLGYIEVAFFGENTDKEFEKELKSVYEKNVTGIILDFRNNGGGYLEIATHMLSEFLRDNLLTITMRVNDESKTEKFYAKNTNLKNIDIPLIMLVNSMSASATEIMAGALQDYQRAIIIGEKTYGKGSVQEPIVMDDGSILKITTGRWYTPKDQNIDKDGITPDVIVPLFDRDYREKYDRQLEAAKKGMLLLTTSGATIESTLENLRSQDFTK